MSKKVNALINKEVLVWARKSAGLTMEAAAQKLKQNQDVINDWENGEKLPTFNQLLKISELYKRPVPLFYLKEPPKDFKPLNDYRRLPGIAPLSESPGLSYEIRKAYCRRQIALELLEDLQEEPTKFSLETNVFADPEKVGENIRSWLKIDNLVQTSWKTDNDALNGWRNAIEAAGILVFQAERIEVSEMRGFAISDRPLPVIVVNKKDTHKGRIFSMLHELTHIILGDSSISGDNSFENRLPPEDKKVEVFCNHVAAAALLPLNFFKSDELLKTFSNRNAWNDEAVFVAAQRFNISREVIWRRLLAIDYINQDTYRLKRQELIKEFESRKDKKDEGAQKVIVPHDRKVIASIGRFYSELILSSYHQQRITSSMLSEYMGMKLKHLPKVEQALFKAKV
jgi:Zn-dependent peptidase ImmA (M78 family)/DNA-binding XRE family transcriptional regulator